MWLAWGFQVISMYENVHQDNDGFSIASRTILWANPQFSLSLVATVHNLHTIISYHLCYMPPRKWTFSIKSLLPFQEYFWLFHVDCCLTESKLICMLAWHFLSKREGGRHDIMICDTGTKSYVGLRLRIIPRSISTSIFCLCNVPRSISTSISMVETNIVDSKGT